MTRKRRQMSVADLARAVGATPSLIRHIERGTASLREARYVKPHGRLAPALTVLVRDATPLPSAMSLASEGGEET